MTDQARKCITIDAPDGSTILAARHLDATEGPVQIGSIVDTATRSAITRVLAYIAKAHNSPVPDADPETELATLRQRLAAEQETSRRLTEQRQEMAEERYAWQERGDRAEAAIARVRELRDTWLCMTLEPGQVRRLLDGITRALGEPSGPA